MQTRPRSQADKHIQTELTDLPALEIRDARLRNAEDLCRLSLSQVGRSEPTLQPTEQGTAHLKFDRVFMRGSQIPQCAPPRWGYMFGVVLAHCHEIPTPALETTKAQIVV